MDLDADARLNIKEFEDGVKPIENFTRGSVQEMKKVYKNT
jgi:preprotein translocase subunit SecE